MISSPLRVLLVAVAVAALAGCNMVNRKNPKPPKPRDMNAIAESYVRLVLAVGEHDQDYVDAYYGPKEWREQVRAQKKSLPAIHSEAVTLIAEAEGQPAGAAGSLEALRRTYVIRQLQALTAYVDHLNGKRLPFDDESRALYDAVAPRNSLESFQPTLDELSRLLPGSGPLHERYQAYRNRFVIPKDRLDGVFKAAIDACRAKTAEHISLPPDESFRLEYVTGKPWSGYNWYQGNFHSLIQVNTEFPIYVDRAIDLACHEGYPGHHVYNVLLERTLVKGKGWIEFTVYPLYSPQSLIAEGSANYGVTLAFPQEERVRFEREQLFPLAGLDPQGAENYYRIQALAEQVEFAMNEIARMQLDEGLSKDDAAALLVKHALMSPERAKQRTAFNEKYRSYVINYNLGQKLVREYVESHAETPAERWKIFTELLSSPRLPSALTPRAP